MSERGSSPQLEHRIKKNRYNPPSNRSDSVPHQQNSLQMIGKITRTKNFKSQEIKRNNKNSYKEQNQSLRSIRATELQRDKKKFATQYAIITSNFKNILLRNNKTNQRTRNSQLGKESSLDKTYMRSSNGDSAGEQKLQFFRNRNKKLDKLYTHKYHGEVTNAAIHGLYKIPLPNSQREFIAEKQKKINQEFEHIPEMIANFNNLFFVRELLEDYKNNYELIIRKIKSYVLNAGGADVSKLENLLKIQSQKLNLRLLLCLQKVVIIGILDSLVREKFIENEAKVLFDSLLGVYYSIFLYIRDDDLGRPFKQKIIEIISILDGLQLHKRKDLISTAEFILKKIPVLFRFNQQFFSKIKYLVEDAKNNKTKINRFFYYILAQYAINLNHHSEIFSTHKHLLDSFATCPSPHLPFARQEMSYTLVIELQNCLGWAKGNNKYILKPRPYAEMVLSELRKYYEIVLITTLMPQSFYENPPIFHQADSILFKYHCLRYRTHLLKDISRIGRKLNSVLLVDSRQDGCINKENILKISPWRGNPLDRELLQLLKVLRNLAEECPQDIREAIRSLGQQNSISNLQDDVNDQDVVEEVEEGLQKSEYYQKEGGTLSQQNLQNREAEIKVSHGKNKKMSKVEVQVNEDSSEGQGYKNDPQT